MMDSVFYDEHGAPHLGKQVEQLGKLHTLNLPSKAPGKGKTPALSGVNIYQTKTASGKVKRDIFTFRVISDSTKGDGQWEYKAQAAHEFMQKAVDEIMADSNNVFTDSLVNALKGAT